MNTIKFLSFLLVLVALSLSEINIRKFSFSHIYLPEKNFLWGEKYFFLVVVIDEGNTVAENGIEGSVSYVEKNNLGTVTTKEILALEDTMEPHQIVEKSV